MLQHLGWIVHRTDWRDVSLRTSCDICREVLGKMQSCPLIAHSKDQASCNCFGVHSVTEQLCAHDHVKD
jgi:hypothetical protein